MDKNKYDFETERFGTVVTLTTFIKNASNVFSNNKDNNNNNDIILLIRKKTRNENLAKNFNESMREIYNMEHLAN